MVGMPRISCLFRGAEPCTLMLTIYNIMHVMLIIMLSLLTIMLIMLIIKLIISRARTIFLIIPCI